jgi:membrane dipeptidase
MDRRRFLTLAGALAAAPLLEAAPARAQASAMRFADMHSHVGMAFSRSVPTTQAIHESMAKNGVVVVARKLVGDEPVIGMSGGRLRAVRTARPGELWRVFQTNLDRAQALHREQNLREIASTDALDDVLRSGAPSIALAAEGADFLETDLKRLEPMRTRGLVHLQLVHYRVSEFGDIATEAYTHNGLSALGRELVAECDRLGLLIDVAHGSAALVDQTLDIAKRPIVYSHVHLTDRETDPSQSAGRARALYTPLAKKLAQKGGVVGIWPMGFHWSSVDAYVEGLLQAADALGIDHVGIGTDMEGIPASVLPTYDGFPDLAKRLAKRGLKDEDVGKIMGGNYLRVLRQALAS